MLIFFSVLPFLSLYKNGFSVALTANFLGLIGLTLMVWQFILGNRFISSKLRENFVDTVKLHIFLGTYGLILVFFHPILQMISYSESLAFIFIPSFTDAFSTSVSYGRFAFYLLIIIWVTSALLRKRMKYRPWLYIHYLNYLIIALAFLHSSAIGTYIHAVPYLNLYWKILLGIIVVGFAWRLAEYLNIGKSQFKLLEKRAVRGDVFIYKLKNIAKPLKVKPGQFAFVRPGFFAEAHPYTIMDFDNETGELQFGIKVVGPHSEKLSKLKLGTAIYIDGPYGVFTREGHNDLPKVLIAGGIGITPFYSLVKNYPNNTFMFYGNSTLSEATARDFLKLTLGNNYVDAISKEKVNGKNMENGRISKEIIKKYLDKIYLKEAKFFVCGSVPFMDSVFQILSELGVPKSRIYSEEFSL